MLNVTVCGAGRAGTAIAADLTLMGHRVTLYEVAEMRRNLAEIEAAGGVELSGDTQSGKEGFARLERITSDPGEALAGAGLIMVAVPAFAHRSVFESIAPCLTKGQKIVVNTGYWASLRFSPALDGGAGGTILPDGIEIAETNIMPYAADRVTPTKTHIFKKKGEMKFAAFPGDRTEGIFSSFRTLYPQTKMVPNVLWTNFAPGNPPIHAPMTIPMAGMIYDRYRSFKFYSEATIPGARLVEACDKERLAVAEALAVETGTEFDWFRDTYGYGGRDIAEALKRSEHAEMETPLDFHNALLEEDLAYFYVPQTSIGDQIGIQTPISKSVITILGAMLGRNFWETGVTAEALGFGDMDAAQIIRYVNTGER